mmetsp:Transcript_11868/g.22991  ORF Transcript_11868/g.22991 Transcript_11868/m.22991 type:complete len:140 (-) Transcript_11868:1315-1734(-)
MLGQYPVLENAGSLVDHEKKFLPQVHHWMLSHYHKASHAAASLLRGSEHAASGPNLQVHSMLSLAQGLPCSRLLLFRGSEHAATCPNSSEKFGSTSMLPRQAGINPQIICSLILVPGTWGNFLKEITVVFCACRVKHGR